MTRYRGNTSTPMHPPLPLPSVAYSSQCLNLCHALQVKLLVDTVVGDADKYSPRDFVRHAVYKIAGVGTPPATDASSTAAGPVGASRYPHIEGFLRVALLGLEVRRRVQGAWPTIIYVSLCHDLFVMHVTFLSTDTHVLDGSYAVTPGSDHSRRPASSHRHHHVRLPIRGFFPFWKSGGHEDSH